MKKFEIPAIEAIQFEVKDIITTSEEDPGMALVGACA